MRRSDKEIKDPQIIQKIFKDAEVCRIALCDGEKPYLVPMNFGYSENRLYLHSATDGRKIDILRKNIINDNISSSGTNHLPIS
jgi:hypothetical protein